MCRLGEGIEQKLQINQAWGGQPSAVSAVLRRVTLTEVHYGPPGAVPASPSGEVNADFQNKANIGLVIVAVSRPSMSRRKCRGCQQSTPGLQLRHLTLLVGAAEGEASPAHLLHRLRFLMTLVRVQSLLVQV